MSEMKYRTPLPPDTYCPKCGEKGEYYNSNREGMPDPGDMVACTGCKADLLVVADGFRLATPAEVEAWRLTNGLVTY